MFLFWLWGIFKNRHLSNATVATGRIRDESLMNLGGRGLYVHLVTLYYKFSSYCLTYKVIFEKKYSD
jgi:hypothetical protein